MRPTPAVLFRYALLCGALLGGGCFRPLFPGSEKVFGNDDLTRGRGGRSTTDGAGLLRKVVTAKEDPATLIAADGYRCMTTADRFRDVKIGESIWCAWKRY